MIGVLGDTWRLLSQTNRLQVTSHIIHKHIQMGCAVLLVFGGGGGGGGESLLSW